MRCLMILLVLLLPVQVFAGNDVYVKGNVGIFTVEDSELNFEDSYGVDGDLGAYKFDTGFGLSAAIGQSHGKFDLELEFAYREADIDSFEGKYVEELGRSTPSGDVDGSVDMKTLMANGIYNFKNNSVVTPYLGAGLGIAWIDSDNIDGTEFAYQVLAGVGMGMNDQVSVLLGYRYLGMGDISEEGTLYGMNGEYSVPIDSHNFEVGLKYSF